MKKVFFYAFISSFLMLTACTSLKTDRSEQETIQENALMEENNNLGSVQKISAEEAKQMMEKGNVTVVDVRTKEEYEEAHIPGAVLVPNEGIGSEQPEKLPDLEDVLLVYCRSGRRSAEAAEKLNQIGYQNVFDFGGIIDWSYDTETGGGDHEE